METLTTLAMEVGAHLSAKGWTLATAESCTGGLLGHAITNVAGSSTYFLGGIIAYANEAKCRLLGVPEALLARHGAVSQ
ncbi:MAG: CinA family protein, partial [Chloroflexi bacterium]|nr:CinA family protein [Chloroflexota bacterium]